MTPTKLDAAAALERMDSMDAAQTAPPAFDYSGLDEQTVDTLHMAENQYTQGKKMAETGLRWMVNAVAMAHDTLCGTVVQQLDNGDAGACPTVGRAHNNQHSEDNFRAWCSSIGVSKSSAYRLLSVSEKFGSIELDGKSILDVQPATLLYEAAKPSAPEKMVQKVTTGEITSSAEYRAILKENQQLRADRVTAMNRAERAESRAHDAETRLKNSCIAEQNAQEALQAAESARDAAIADVNGLMEQNTQLRKDYNTANEDRIAANLQRQKAEAQRDKAEARAKEVENQLAGSRKVVEAARLRGDKLKAEVDSLKSQPITAVVDQTEVERRAQELANAQVAEIRANLEKAQDSVDDRQAYDSVIMAGRALYSIWMAVKPLISKLKPSTRTFALEQVIQPAKHIIEEAEKCL